MSSPEARGLSWEWIAEHGDPDLDFDVPPDPQHWRRHEEDLDQFTADRFMAEYPLAVGSPGAPRRTAVEVPFDRARFDESLELARTQLAFPPPEPETDNKIDDEERER